MARIPGVKIVSFTIFGEQEENERDVALNHQDPDRWGKTGDREMGTSFVPQEGRGWCLGVRRYPKH